MATQALKHRAGTKHRKQQRLEARITPDQKRLIERAANLRGTTVTEFVVASAQQAAAETIRDFEILTLRDEARKVFVDAILNPPPPNQAARSAARRYKAEFGA
jgi:uncharacterized protein (DUF1778 family)